MRIGQSDNQACGWVRTNSGCLQRYEALPLRSLQHRVLCSGPACLPTREVDYRDRGPGEKREKGSGIFSGGDQPWSEFSSSRGPCFRISRNLIWSRRVPAALQIDAKKVARTRGGGHTSALKVVVLGQNATATSSSHSVFCCYSTPRIAG